VPRTGTGEPHARGEVRRFRHSRPAETANGSLAGSSSPPFVPFIATLDLFRDRSFGSLFCRTSRDENARNGSTRCVYAFADRS